MPPAVLKPEAAPTAKPDPPVPPESFFSRLRRKWARTGTAAGDSCQPEVTCEPYLQEGDSVEQVSGP